jgi:hypothetical protein
MNSLLITSYIQGAWEGACSAFALTETDIQVVEVTMEAGCEFSRFWRLESESNVECSFGSTYLVQPMHLETQRINQQYLHLIFIYSIIKGTEEIRRNSKWFKGTRKSKLVTLESTFIFSS